MKCIAVITSAAMGACACAGPIWSPVGVVRNDFGENNANYPISRIFSQEGLYTGFTSGVTDFDTYSPSTQLHAFGAFGNEWFSAPSGFVAGGVIDLDLGAAMDISRVAIWNEDAGGIETLNIYTSTDPLFGTSTFVGQFTLTDNLLNADYAAEVLDLIDSFGRYVRLEILTIPQGTQWPNGVSIGEIAFEEMSTQIVPLPSAAALGGLGLLAVGARRRRGSM